MRKTWMGLTTAALLLGSAGSALANKGAQQTGTPSTNQQRSSNEGYKSEQASTQGEHRLTGQRLQHLRQVRLHAFALAGREDDDGQRHGSGWRLAVGG